MSSCLDRITDWSARAQACRYSAARLARQCQVSARHLERYFHLQHGLTPHQWLRQLRLRLALKMMQVQTPLKVVAIELGYQNPSHFSHDFKDYFGVRPSRVGHAAAGLAAGRPNVAF